MYRSRYAVQADTYAQLAADAETPAERDVYLSMETSWRHFAESDRRINDVRTRNKAVFARKPDPRMMVAAE
jgi:alkyl sulfatase BDS1-like metallo-beta-lactamase superfamily hydrolase